MLAFLLLAAVKIVKEAVSVFGGKQEAAVATSADVVDDKVCLMRSLVKVMHLGVLLEHWQSSLAS